MNRGVWLAAGLLALLLAAAAFWPENAPAPAAAPAPAPDAAAVPDAPAEQPAFLHANWNTTPTERSPAARAPRPAEKRPAIALPAGLRGVEVALPVARPETQR